MHLNAEPKEKLSFPSRWKSIVKAEPTVKEIPDSVPTPMFSTKTLLLARHCTCAEGVDTKMQNRTSDVHRIPQALVEIFDKDMQGGELIT